MSSRIRQRHLGSPGKARVPTSSSDDHQEGGLVVMVGLPPATRSMVAPPASEKNNPEQFTILSGGKNNFHRRGNDVNIHIRSKGKTLFGKGREFSRIRVAIASMYEYGSKNTTRYRRFVAKYGKYLLVVICILTISIRIIFILFERKLEFGGKRYQGIVRPWPSFRRESGRSSMVHPMVIGCYFEDYTSTTAKTSESANKSSYNMNKNGKITRIRHLPIHDEDRYPSKRQVEWTSHDADFHKSLLDSKKYNKARADRVGMPTKDKQPNVNVNTSSEEVEQSKGVKIKMREEMGWKKHSDKDECTLPYEWMVRPHPTCNSIHERNLNTFFIESSTMADENVRLIANGFWRDVWKIRDDINPSSEATSTSINNEKTALTLTLTKEESSSGSVHIAAKTLRYEHDYTERNLDRHIRDAIAMDQTTSSPYILDMHAYCGHTIFTELADSAPGAASTVSDMIWPDDDKPCKVPMRERLNVALGVARGVRDFHYAGAMAGNRNSADNGNEERQVPATMAHTDVTPSQFVFVNGKIKMNDFNRCRFIARRDSGDVCPFRVSSNPGKFRSPEEYAYKAETEKVDVYSMGNVFYSLLTEMWPNEEMKSKDAQDAVMNNVRPVVPDAILQMPKAGDFSVQILLTAMHKCWTHNPSKRPSSKEIVAYLESEIKKWEINLPPST